MSQETDFDNMLSNHGQELMKAAIPFLDLRHQKILSLFIKFQELRRIMELFSDGGVQLKACGLCADNPNPEGMIETLRKHCYPQEREFLDTVWQTLQTLALVNQMRESQTGAPDGSSPLDLLEYLSPQGQETKLNEFEQLFHPEGGTE